MWLRSAGSDQLRLINIRAGSVDSEPQITQTGSDCGRAHQRQRARGGDTAVTDVQGGEGAAAGALCQCRCQCERTVVAETAISVQLQL